MGKINRRLRRLYNSVNRARLRNKEFSLICNDCIGGMILHDLGLRFRSPTVNLYIQQRDYLRFLSDLPRYLSEKLVFSDEDEREKGFPVAVIGGDVKIFFMHYSSRGEAEQKWVGRAKRVDPKNLFVLFSNQRGCPYEILEEFDRLPYENKLALTNIPYPELSSAFCIPGFEINAPGKAFYSFRNKHTAFKYYDRLPYVRWFNGKLRGKPPAAQRRPKPGAIHIGKPYLEQTAEGVRLCAQAEHCGKQETVWFEVRGEFAKYLTCDRADAFAVGLLTTAMREGRDIVCDAPVSYELLARLNNSLLPIVGKNIREYRPIRVFAEPTDAPIASAGAVGTGWTGGADSLYTVKNTLCEGLSHLLITSNGAIEDDGGHSAREILREMEKKAENGFAAETGLKVIAVDTDLHEVQNEIFITVFAFRHAAVILALQGLFGRFYWSTGASSLEPLFTLKNCGHYDSLVYDCLSTKATAIKPFGSGVSRTDKLSALCSYPPAYKYLHPCIHAQSANCCQCGKCVRTMAALDTLDKLELFSEAFDVGLFRREKDSFISRLLSEAHNPDARDVLKRYRERGEDLSRPQAAAREPKPAEAQVIVGKRGIYSRKAPDGGSPTAFFIPGGRYSIVEARRDGKGKRWGRLLTGYGWIDLGRVAAVPGQNPVYRQCAALYRKFFRSV